MHYCDSCLHFWSTDGICLIVGDFIIHHLLSAVLLHTYILERELLWTCGSDSLECWSASPTSWYTGWIWEIPALLQTSGRGKGNMEAFWMFTMNHSHLMKASLEWFLDCSSWPKQSTFLHTLTPPRIHHRSPLKSLLSFLCRKEMWK